MLVQSALANYFPGMHIFMPLFLLILGFTATISYFCTGIKCAEFLSPKIGRKVYYVYALCCTLIFVCFHSSQALTLLSVTAGLLLLINSYGFYKLSDQIDFTITPYKAPQVDAKPVLEQTIS